MKRGSRRLGRWGFCIALLLATLLTRLLWMRTFPGDPTGPVDAEGFHLLAVNTAAGRGFAIGWEAPFCPTAVRTPLYPLWLMGVYRLLGTGPARAVLFQVLLEALTTALVIRLGRDLGGARGGILAGALYTLNGTTQRYTGYLLSEALLLPLLAAALLLTLRAMRRPGYRRSARSACFWGLALLTKPNVQFLVLAVGLLLAWQIVRGRGKSGLKLLRSLAFWAALAAMVFPWLLRNRLVMGRWLLSTAFEENLSRVSAVATLAEASGVAADPWTETWEYLYVQIVSQAGARCAWRTDNAAPLTCAEVQTRQEQVAEVAREIVRQHPQAFLATHFWGVELSLLDPGHRLWYRVLTGRDWATTGVVDNVWMRVAWSLERNAFGDALTAFWSERVTRIPADAAIVWWGLMLGRVAVWGFSLRGLWRLRRTPALWLLGGTVVYLILLPGPIAYDRFYAPAIPAVAVLLAVGAKPVTGFPPQRQFACRRTTAHGC
ncbi:MAG: glycosyltransferase family 39 protein [Anaerolineae bacterium]|nr:glycosyltransferase family 39 protein [Anaerolineae bacterium]